MHQWPFGPRSQLSERSTGALGRGGLQLALRSGLGKRGHGLLFPQLLRNGRLLGLLRRQLGQLPASVLIACACVAERASCVHKEQEW